MRQIFEMLTELYSEQLGYKGQLINCALAASYFKAKRKSEERKLAGPSPSSTSEERKGAI